MNPVPMQCPLCAGTIQIDPAYAGQQVACPLCQGVMLLPPPEFFGLPPGFPVDQGAGYPPQEYSQPGFHSQYQQAPAANLPQLGCPVCGGAFQVSPQMMGQQMACPHCHSAVMIPDLFGGIPTGMPPQGGPEPLAPPPHEMQFIGLPPTVDGASPAYPSFYSPPQIPELSSPAVPMGTPVSCAQSPQQSQPSDERYPPGMRPEEKPATAATMETPQAREAGLAEGLYPPGMRPKESAPKPQERGPERSLSDDRFPPGARRRDATRKDVPRTEREQLYPPGYQPPAEEPQEAKRSAPASAPAADERLRTQVDDLLPPGAASTAPPVPSPVEALRPPEAGTSSSAERAGTTSAPSVVDALLPPGAPLETAALPGEQVALPEAPPPAPKRMPAAGRGTVLVPTPDGDYVTVENREGVTVIEDRGEEIEIRKLSPEEKMKRRRRKNLIMFAFGILLLVVVVIIMTRR